MRSLLVLSALVGSPAWANGQSSHVYIGLDARQYLPANTDLRNILEAPEHVDWLVSGAMFPDGGYSPLSRDDYGEIAHWEPFQFTYLQWIKDTYPDLCEEEALQHIVLAFGMGAHGMADQIFDALYLERSRSLEPEAWSAGGDFDAATDVVFTSLVGPQPRPSEDILPYPTLVEVFDRYGYEASEQTMAAGQAALNLAVAATSSLGQDAAAVDRHIDLFPWGTTQQDNAAIPGAPSWIGKAVAAYWQAQWDRLHERFDPARQWVVWVWPTTDHEGLEPSASNLNSQVALLFGKTVNREAVDDADIQWQGPEGPVSFTRRLYYRDQSNVLLLRPSEDLSPSTRYTLTLGQGMVADDGSTLTTDLSWAVTTAAQADASDPTVEGIGDGGPWAAEPSLATHPAACPGWVASTDDTDPMEVPRPHSPEDGQAQASCAGCQASPSASAALGGALWALIGWGRWRRRRQPWSGA